MGVLGTVEYLSDLFGKAKKKKKKQLTTVSVKIRMDCVKVVNVKLRTPFGSKRCNFFFYRAKSVDVDMKLQKATVYGYVDAKKVLAAAKATGKKVELWLYVPYNMIAHPYAPGVYDKKAPPNTVRKTDIPGVATLTPDEEQYSIMFSDENPNACSIM